MGKESYDAVAICWLEAAQSACNSPECEQAGSPDTKATNKSKSPKMGCVTDDPQIRIADLTESAHRVPPHKAA
jgi:hypothetical protein